MNHEVRLLLDTLKSSPEGLTRSELMARLREHVPHLQPNDVERVIRKAGDAVREEDGRLFVALTAELEDDRSAEVGLARPMRRFIVFDLESIVRPIIKEPYKEQHVFQIGAIRFGPDAAWVAEAPQFGAFTELKKAEDELLIYSDELRARYEAEKRPLAEVLEEFRLFCHEAACSSPRVMPPPSPGAKRTACPRSRA